MKQKCQQIKDINKWLSKRFVFKILTFANITAEMEQKKEYSILLKKISNYCVTRERSVSEVEDKLRGWDVEEDKLHQIIDLLKKENLLNENRFISAFVNDKFQNHGWGKNKIIQNLEYLKINNTLIEDAIAKISEIEYKEMAISLIKKSKNNKSIYFTMINKGYEEELIMELLQSMNLTEIQ